MTTKSKRQHPKMRKSGTLSKSVFLIASEMEEPLCDAMHFAYVLSLVEIRESNDYESIAFVATKARVNLERVHSALRQLFEICGNGKN
jgi:hypothetical protein